MEIKTTILNDIKTNIGVPLDVKDFDNSLSTYTTATLLASKQLGIVYPEGIVIDDSTLWSDLKLSETISAIFKPYVTMKVKMIFDPPDRNNIKTATESFISEMEFRLMTELREEALL